MLVRVKNVKSTFSRQQRRMGVMTRNAPPINDWMTVETAKIAKSGPIRLKMVRPANPDAMPNTR